MKLRSKLLICLTVGFIALVVWKVVIPNLVRAKTTSGNACIHNLRQVQAAIQQWAQENNKLATDSFTSNDIAPYLLNYNLNCPKGGSYTFGPVVSNGVTCSFPGHKLLP